MACGETGSSELEKKEPAAAHMTNRKKKTQNPQIQAKPHRHSPSSRVRSNAEDEVVR